jgi:DamX protein
MHEPSGALLDPATLAGMGIQQQPFETVREDSLFMDESLELQVQMLRHNLRYSNMLQVLCGRPGAGKTTLTIGLIRVVNQELELFLVRGERGLTSSRIFADLLRALDCQSTADSATDVLTFIRELTGTTGDADTPAALVVDDAHLLERRELAELLDNTIEIDRGSTSGFRLLLVGQPSLRDKLESIESPLLAPGRVYSADIKPFSVEQTQAYLAHRLSGVGASWPFDDEEVASIAESAHGLPGVIDRVAATALNHKHAVETVPEEESVAVPVATASRPGLIRAVAAGAIVVVAVTWTLWPQDRSQPEPPPSRPLALPEPPAVAPLQPVFKDEAEQLAVKTIPAPPPAPDVAPEPAIEPPAQPVDESVPASASKPLTDTKPVATETPDTSRTAQSGSAQKPPAATAVQREEPHDSVWLRQQRKDHYMVQLMAARDRRVLQQFIDEQALGSRAAVFSTRREGLPWHVLLYGLYANADLARAAIPDLPAGLRTHSPWIRSVGSVQKAIREQTP